MAKGESCLYPGPEEQLQHKPAKLTQSPWASHMHYSNQSILDLPDTLDIWVSVSSLPSPSVSPSTFFRIPPRYSSQWIPRSHSCFSRVRDWNRFLTVQLLCDMFPHSVKLGAPYACLTSTCYKFEVHIGRYSNYFAQTDFTSYMHMENKRKP